MINFNGELRQTPNVELGVGGLLSGDFVYEPFVFRNGKGINQEKHYFNLVSSMRILRLNIPLSFTEEFVWNQCEQLFKANTAQESDYLFYCYRNQEGATDFIILEKELENDNLAFFEIELYKDFVCGTNFYDGLNAAKPFENIATVFAQENDLNDLVFLNNAKKVARTLKGDLVLFKENEIWVSEQSQGRLRNVALEHMLEWSKRKPEYKILEKEFFGFELTQCNAMGILYSNYHIQAVSKFRKHELDTQLVKAFNESFYKDLLVQTIL